MPYYSKLRALKNTLNFASSSLLMVYFRNPKFHFFYSNFLFYIYVEFALLRMLTYAAHVTG